MLPNILSTVTILSLTGATLTGTAALAQAKAPPAAAAAGLGGPLIPGICLLTREAVFANAAVGKAATARLRQLAEQAQAEIDAERRPLDTDVGTYRAEAPKLPADQRAAREKALGARLSAIEAKAQQRGREIEATRVKALQRVASETQPVIDQVYRQRACGLLLDRGIVLGGNTGNDLTAAVVQGLDARITTITFNREVLPAQAPAAPR